MEEIIWIVVNAGGNSRSNEVADDFNARACLELTERRLSDEADILAEGPYRQAERVKEGGRIVIHQGGGKAYRERYGSGQLVACGYVRGGVRPLTEVDQVQYKEQYELTRRYFPKDKPNNNLVGIVFYLLKRAKLKLPIEEVGIRPGRGDKFIQVGPEFHGYHTINEWWNKNYTG